MATVSEIQGILRLKGGSQFSRQVKSRLDGVKHEFSKLETAIKGSALFLGLRRFNQEAIEAQNALLGLQSIAQFRNITGVDKAVKDLKAVKLGLIDFKDAAASLQNLLRRGFTLEQAIVLMNRIAEAAAFSRQQHLSFGEAIKSATQGLKNENSILLDNAGITKNLAQMWKEYATQIGKGAMSLTLAEKIQAEYNGILKETEANIGKTGERLSDLDKLMLTSGGKQAQLTARFKEFSVVAGRVAQSVLDPLVILLTKLFERFEKLSPSAQRLTVATGAVSAAIWVLRGAIQALLPALGPVGWIVLGVSAVASLFGVFEANAGMATEALAKFRDEAKGLNVDQLRTKVSELSLELLNLETRSKVWLGLGGGGAILAHSKRVKELREQIATLNNMADELEKKSKPNKPTTDSSAAKQLTDDEKKLLDEQMQNQFEHHQISRAAYLAYLQGRIKDFKQWSDEWTDIHDQILALEKEKNAERLGEEAKLLQQTLEMRSQFIEQYQQTMERANTAVLDNLRDNMNQMQALVQEKVSFISDAFGRMGDALVQSFSAAKMNPAKMQLKGFFKEILIGTIEFLQRFLIAAKIKTIAESAINWTAALKSAAPLIAANALLEGLKGQVAAMANGSYVTAPTLALVGEAGQPEIVAPERDFMSYSNMLIDRVLNQRPNNTVNHGGVTMVNNFNTPLQDRRMARLLAEQNSQQVKREMKRSKRYLNQ